MYDRFYSGLRCESAKHGRARIRESTTFDVDLMLSVFEDGSVDAVQSKDFVRSGAGLVGEVLEFCSFSGLRSAKLGAT